MELAIGIGGLPKGRIVEFFGVASAGKTTLAMNSIKQVQRRGGVVTPLKTRQFSGSEKRRMELWKKKKNKLKSKPLPIED